MAELRPCLGFNGRAEEAVGFYVALLPDSRIDRLVRLAADTPFAKAGTLIAIEFTLAGRPYMALDAGPPFRFTEAVSLSVQCNSQTEVDRLWDALTADGGEPSMCGWLKDRFGLSWQITPRRMLDLLYGADRERAGRAFAAMMTMSKLDIAALEAA